MTKRDFLRLPGGNWGIWRGIVLRSAGFPVRLVDRLGDEVLADAADRCQRPTDTRRSGTRPDDSVRYEAEFDAASARIHDVINELARNPGFREAIAWQNRELLDTCLDRVPSSARRDSRSRRREAVIASYLQRYTTKNDSIGFFGPIGWASWQLAGPAAAVVAGAELLGRRTVYFETWAMDAMAAALAARPELLPGLPPRRVPANHVCGDVVHLPVGPPVQLSDEDAEILRLCDGIRTVRDIVRCLSGADSSTMESKVAERLRSMRDRSLICLDFGGPIEANPERRLRQRLLRIPDRGARLSAVQDLDHLVAARDAVAVAAGDGDAVAKAIGVMNEDFERLTGAEHSRLHGQTYAGRTVVYEDTVRDVNVHIGPDVLAELGPPLSLVLDSARWLAVRVEQDCLCRLMEHYERRCRRTGDSRVPLANLLALATRDFYTKFRAAPVVGPAVAELQRRWHRILAIPPGSRRHKVATSAVAPAVAMEFASRSPRWAAGLHHSPDVMIAASSVDAINRGDYQLVLGELHPAYNTVESRAFVEQSPDPRGLLSMAEVVTGGRRIVPVAPRAWGAVTARTSPPSALLSPTYVYWAMGTDDVSDLPVEPIPVAALQVTRVDGELTVHCQQSGRVFPLVEMLGDYLSGSVANAFRMLPPKRRSPRITIGRLVVARETWRLAVRDCAWAFELNERRRYRLMRTWLQRHGIPRRAFYSVSIEIKPTYVDFTSMPLVNVLARVVRRVGESTPDGAITISEMLPDPSESWLADAAGAAYTSELRMVAAEHWASATEPTE